jgi:hypothetical protein
LSGSQGESPSQFEDANPTHLALADLDHRGIPALLLSPRRAKRTLLGETVFQQEMKGK